MVEQSYHNLYYKLTMFGHSFLVTQVADKQGDHNDNSNDDKPSHNSSNNVVNSQICTSEQETLLIFVVHGYHTDCANMQCGYANMF